eukprot:TRINITY_DN12103_c0_g1_i3.p1 TRINITY_DN12103_c0_g1~~TRINITY_DN12103_c0_g1_i3.p1  ORF type:complete len:380 (+),score=59.69 TRINITY_DN12103_c0_g1_i3:1395-2534(+)
MEQSIISLNLKKTGCHLLTRQIFHQGPRLSGDGLLHLASLTPGTSVSLNENADPTVRPDLQQAFTLMSNDSPVEAAVLMGLTLSIPVQGGRPDLGTWQGVYVANFTGQTSISILATYLPGRHLGQVSSTAPERGSFPIADTVCDKLPKEEGLVLFHLKHTSAAITVGHDAPSVGSQLEASLNSLVPETWNDKYFTHNYEGPDDMPGHVKSSLVGTDVAIATDKDGRPLLGKSQTVYLVEPRDGGGWGGGHRRKISRTFVGKDSLTHRTRIQVKPSSTVDLAQHITSTISSMTSGLVHVTSLAGHPLVVAPPDHDVGRLLPAKFPKGHNSDDSITLACILGCSVVLAIREGQVQLPEGYQLKLGGRDEDEASEMLVSAFQ